MRVFLVVAIISCFGVCGIYAQTIINGRSVANMLYTDNKFDSKAGSWGIQAICRNGSFVDAVEIKYQPPGHLDETAINAIKLYCRDNQTGFDTGYVTSGIGKDGDWYGMAICPHDYLTGFKAKILEYQGTFTDDVALQDFDAECDHGKYMLNGLPVNVPQLKDFKEGNWGTWAQCEKGTAVCGLETRVEPDYFGDDVAIADVVLYCCCRDEFVGEYPCVNPLR